MNQAEITQIIDSDEKWDTGELGRDENFAEAIQITPELRQTIDDAVGLQMISIRLSKSLIEDFKFLGDHYGIKYQTLMRQVLARFADAEKKNLARKAASAQIKAARQESSAPAKQETKLRSKIA
jgi:uncharacterized protein (DUF4415 family)